MMMQVLAHQSLFSCTNHCTSSPQLASASWFCCGVNVLKSVLADFNFAIIFQREVPYSRPPFANNLAFLVHLAIPL